MRSVIVNFSGGVDSSAAALKALEIYPREEIILCYQDTDADYLETLPHVENIARTLDLPLVTLRDDEGFWGMARQYGGFPLHGTRVCTRKLKADITEKWIRANRANLGDEVIQVFGFRAEEGQGRANMEPFTLNERLTLKRSEFKAYYHLPVHDMSKLQVKEYVTANGLSLHPCYEFSERCSCWCCIFQPPHVVREYAEMQPELYKQACLIEDEIRHKWTKNIGFNDLMKQGRLI